MQEEIERTCHGPEFQKYADDMWAEAMANHKAEEEARAAGVQPQGAEAAAEAAT